MNGDHFSYCPHPECDGRIRIARDRPFGNYPCICGACMVRLSWDHYQSGGRRPRLTLVEEEQR